MSDIHDVHAVANAYLNSLRAGGGVSELGAVMHTTREINPSSEYGESAGQFLVRMAKEFAAMPEAESVLERIEIAEPKFIVRVGRARFFNGLLRERAVLGFSAQLAQEVNGEEGEKARQLLARFGYADTELCPSLKREASF